MNKPEAKRVVLDVRTPAEYADSHVKTSINIDFLAPTFIEKISQLDKSHSYKLYCRSGTRSGNAAVVMKDLGFQDVENLGTLDEAASSLKMSCESTTR